MSLVVMVFGFSSASSAQHCIVRDGDSIWKIAQRYKVPFEEMMRLNRHLHNPHLIYPLDKIELPDNSEHGTGAHTAQESPPPSEDQQNDNDQSFEHGNSAQAQAVLSLVNEERSKQGLRPLKLSSKLTSIATLKSRDMADKNYFDHQSPTYGSPFDMLHSYGVQYRSAGENIAAGQRTPEEVMQAWMNSSGHRANILNKDFTEIGIGYYQGGSYKVYWTQMFIGS